MENIWFEDWQSITRTIILSTLGYAAMVFLLRISGKRTLSKMNAFDFIITIALGSILASIALNKDISLADGAAAVLVFISLQFLLTWLSVRIRFFKTLITDSPSLIFYKGNYLPEAMKKERITIEEIQSAGRGQGYTSLDEIDMIILETTGEVTILENIVQGKKSTLGKIDPPQ